ncbi:MAG: dihydroorotase [Thermodesulfobacteriota bacterium]|nr:dihydroorotase [Thermodesulfobacteriota bacterium]
MKTILIKDARIVNEGIVNSGDLFIKNGRIDRIGSGLTGLVADITIDADGKVVMPGMIDAHVHFRQPGMTHKGDIASESRAAVAGGITTYLEMPNTLPPTTTVERLEQKYQIASQSSLANYAFYLGATHNNLDEIKRLDPQRVGGVKMFMGSSTGNMLVDEPETMNRIFAEAPILVAVHCEDPSIIKENEAIYRSRFGENVPMKHHPDIRSAEACYQSTALAVERAQRYGTRLHVLHLSTHDELSLFSDRPLSGKSITAEACVHHLFFDAGDYTKKGTLIKCNPAIKSRQDREALIRAVKANRIDTIATDHAPHTLAEKENSYFKAPSGLPLVQHALVSLLELYHQGIFSLELIAEKTAHAPAEIFQIEQRGYIREGYWADLVLVDLHQPWTVSAENIRSKCGWSPFDGYRFRSAIIATIVSGHPVWDAGKIDGSVKGRRLRFNR